MVLSVSILFHTTHVDLAKDSSSDLQADCFKRADTLKHLFFAGLVPADRIKDGICKRPDNARVRDQQNRWRIDQDNIIGFARGPYQLAKRARRKDISGIFRGIITKQDVKTQIWAVPDRVFAAR